MSALLPAFLTLIVCLPDGTEIAREIMHVRQFGTSGAKPKPTEERTVGYWAGGKIGLGDERLQASASYTIVGSRGKPISAYVGGNGAKPEAQPEPAKTPDLAGALAKSRQAHANAK